MMGDLSPIRLLSSFMISGEPAARKSSDPPSLRRGFGFWNFHQSRATILQQLESSDERMQSIPIEKEGRDDGRQKWS